MTGEQIVQLDPSEILADDNSRFNLKRERIEALAANILQVGQVLSPVEVEAIEPSGKGKPAHRLTAGFYRHAAVELLNSRDKAGLTLPVIVRSTTDKLERLRHQISENVEREDMSPMDTAVAIKRLLDAGTDKPTIRQTFARPGVNAKAKGKNGNVQLQPMSNAMLNIFLRFLDLPKAIQQKIHDGTVGVAAAYELGKVPAEKRQAVLDRAEADRLAAAQREEKDEEKYLTSLRKVEETKEKVVEAVAAVETAKDGVAESEKMVAVKTQDLRTVQAENYDPSDSKAKAAYMEKLKAAETDLKAAQKLLKDSKNKVAKALESKAKAEDAAKEKAAEPKREGKAGKGKSTAVNPTDIKKAAQAEGASTGYAPLNLGEIREAFKDLASGKYAIDDRGVLVMKLVKSLTDGAETPKLFAESLGKLLDSMGCSLPKAKK